ncbi:DUF3050 domain-containing protein [Halobacteriovorax sp. GFR7]|uniref:DUF3050 domain-containing protein n=1 Tax=unclassified Halobacteriovorax TaxID=2639665 RepID=UPI003D99EC26
MKTVNIAIQNAHNELCAHPLYTNINDIEDVKILMKWHVFAVWDFMSLLKGLQKEVTCVTTPWMPSKYDKECVRFINEIVLGEESDEDLDGGHIDHFTMYLNAMKEVGADTAPIENFLKDFSFDELPQEIAKFTAFNLNLVTNAHPSAVASAFFYGRENLIPDLFQPFVNVLEQKNIDAPYFKHYLVRHIELDGDEHGDLAGKLLTQLSDSKEKEDQATQVALDSLKLRSQMWDYVLEEIRLNRSENLEPIH